MRVELSQTRVTQLDQAARRRHNKRLTSPSAWRMQMATSDCLKIALN